MPNGSITAWLGPLKDGDENAAQQLWKRYFSRLAGLARSKLRRIALGVADEEDVALSVIDSFCRRAEADRFPQLGNREDLWKLLVVITARKATRLLRDEQRQKRGGQLARSIDDRERVELESLLGSEPTPEFAVEVADECHRLLELLGRYDLRQVAIRRMEGFGVDEIATEMNCTPRTISRKLSIIRDLWREELL